MRRARFAVVGALLILVRVLILGREGGPPLLHGQYVNGSGPKTAALPLTPTPTPTPHPLYYGGPVVSSMQVVIVLWGTGSYLPQVASSSTPSMSSFFQQVLNSAYIDSLDYAYNTVLNSPVPGNGSGTGQVINHGAFVSKVTITPSIASTDLFDSDIQTELINQIKAGHLPAPTHDANVYAYADTFYAVFFPPGFSITDPNGLTSCTYGGFCAYHSTGNGGPGVGKFVYSIHPDMQAGSGCAACGTGTTFNIYMTAASHELAETITDAEVGLATNIGDPLAWYDANDGEIADPCVSNNDQVSLLGGDGQTYTVQKLFYSGHGCTATIPVPDFTMSVNPSYVTVPQGSATSAAISTTRVGPASYVSFAPTGASGGLTVGVTAALGVVTSGSGTTLMISASAGTPVGEQTITLTGTTVVPRGGSFGPLGASSKVHTTPVKVYITDAGAAPFAASGNGFRVNTTTGSETDPAVGMDQSGAFVVAWKSETHDLLAQRYSRFGAPLAGEFRVNSSTASGVYEPAASGSSSGAFTVVWRGGSEIEGQRYASGVPQGSEFQVNSVGGYYEAKPRVGSDWDGNFVVAWGRAAGPSSSFDPWARLFSSSGAPLGGEFRIDTIFEPIGPGFFVDGNAWAPSIAVTPPDTFVVAWSSNAPPAAVGAVWAQTRDANGAFGTEFLPNQYGAAAGAPPSVAIGAGGNFVVTWSGTYLWGQRYAPNASALGAAFRVDSGAPNPPFTEKVVSDSAGNFVIVWSDAASAQIQARRYASSGAPFSNAFRVDGSTGAPVQLGDVAMDPKGDVVVVWQQGSNPSDVFARLYCGGIAGDVDGSGTIDVADVFYLINHLFAGGPAPLRSGDANGDGVVDIADVFFLINFLFAGGPLPACA